MKSNDTTAEEEINLPQKLHVYRRRPIAHIGGWKYGVGGESIKKFCLAVEWLAGPLHITLSSLRNSVKTRTFRSTRRYHSTFPHGGRRGEDLASPDLPHTI